MLGTILVCSAAMFLAGLGSVALTPRDSNQTRRARNARMHGVALDCAARSITLQPGAG